MASSSDPAGSQRFGWVLALVSVAFVLGIWLGRSSPPTAPDRTAPVAPHEVEVRIDPKDVTLWPDASLEFDATPKNLEDFIAPNTPAAGGHEAVDRRHERR